MANFEGYERRKESIDLALKKYNLKSLDNCKAICDKHNINVDEIIKGIQPIAFDNASWGYTLGCAIALSQKTNKATDMAKYIGEGLQAFSIPT